MSSIKYLNHQSQFGSCGRENKFNYILSCRAHTGRQNKSIAVAAGTKMESGCLYDFRGVILNCLGQFSRKNRLSTHE